MNQPLISVIVPVYNVEKYLHQCVDSILNQSFNDIEVILVDDGSLDRCPEICDEYAKKDDRVTVIHKENGGSSDARNTGIIKSTGQYILFVDSDDFIKAESLGQIVQTLDEDLNVDVIFLEASKFFTNTNTYVPLGDGYKKSEILNKTQMDVLNHIASLPKYPASAWSKLVKRELILKNELFFIKGITTEDLDWTIRLLMVAKRYNYCESEYYVYRQAREGSITNTFNKKKFTDFFNVIKTWSNLSHDSIEYTFKDQIYSLMAYEYTILLPAYAKLCKEDKKVFKQEVKSYSWIMDYREDKKNKLVRIIFKIFGIDLTSNLLNFYLKIR